MKRIVLSLLAGAIGVAAIAAVNADGKSLFTTNKCNACHQVSKAGIAKLGGSGGIDLSTVGSKHNAAWFEKYLKKEESLNGKKHAKKWSGSDADLKVLAGWLASLK